MTTQEPHLPVDDDDAVIARIQYIEQAAGIDKQVLRRFEISDSQTLPSTARAGTYGSGAGIASPHIS